MFRKLSDKEQRKINPILTAIAKTWTEQMKDFWNNPKDSKDPYRIGKEDNPIVLYPHVAEALGIDYQDFVPFEYHGLWYVVSGKLNS